MQEEPLAEVSEEMEWFDFTVAVSAAAADGGNILKLYAWYGDSLEMNEQKDDVPALRFIRYRLVSGQMQRKRAWPFRKMFL